MSDEIKSKVNRYLINETDFLKVKDKMNDDQLRLFIDEAITSMAKDQKLEIPMEARIDIVRNLVSAAVSLGPMRELMEDKSISEVMVNGASNIYIQRSGKIIKTDLTFGNNQVLLHTVQKILSGSGSNKRVDESSPYVDFSLLDGSRVNVILPPCSLIGPVMTVRKFNEDIATVEDLIDLQMLDSNIATLLVAAMESKLNVIFCGSTGAGKTTALNVFSRHIPEHERIITIEDTPELRLLQEHVVPLITKAANIEGKGEITLRHLFVNSLRMRPDRIIIGEVRGEEMLDLIQSISSGHSGSLAIVHAESPQDCFNRMVTMMLMTGIRLSTDEIRKQVARAIDIIVHIELFVDGRRRVTHVTDIVYDEETKHVKLNDIFAFKSTGLREDGFTEGHWVMNKKKPFFYNKLAKRRVSLPEDFFKDSD